MKFNELYESILNERFVNKSKEIKNKWVDLSDTDIKKDSKLADELFDLVDLALSRVINPSWFLKGEY